MNSLKKPPKDLRKTNALSQSLRSTALAIPQGNSLGFVQIAPKPTIIQEEEEYQQKTEKNKEKKAKNEKNVKSSNKNSEKNDKILRKSDTNSEKSDTFVQKPAKKAEKTAQIVCKTQENASKSQKPLKNQQFSDADPVESASEGDSSAEIVKKRNKKAWFFVKPDFKNKEEKILKGYEQAIEDLRKLSISAGNEAILKKLKEENCEIREKNQELREKLNNLEEKINDFTKKKAQETKKN